MKYTKSRRTRYPLVEESVEHPSVRFLHTLTLSDLLTGSPTVAEALCNTFRAVRRHPDQPASCRRADAALAFLACRRERLFEEGGRA